MDSVASRYAKALFDLALEGQAVVAFQREMKEVKGVIQSNPDLTLLLAHYNISKEDKKILLSRIFKDNVSALTLNFLQLLVDKSRIMYIEKICDEFARLANKHRGIQEGVVYSTSLFAKEEMAKIQSRIEKERNCQIQLINEVDETLIGGFKVVIGDTVYDNSLKNKIDSLRYELLAGKR